MGGHAAGEVASKVAVDAINEFVCLTSGDEEITWPFGLDENISYDGNRLKTAIRHANRKVLDATKERNDLEGMATTVAAVLVDGDQANLGHVGDSRTYLFSEGELTQLTTDHSWVNEQIQSGVISADQARTHPLRNVVTRALGGKLDLAVDVQSRIMRPGEILLICSDGLTTMVPDPKIAGDPGRGRGRHRTGGHGPRGRRQRPGRRGQHHGGPAEIRRVRAMHARSHREVADSHRPLPGDRPHRPGRDGDGLSRPRRDPRARGGPQDPHHRGDPRRREPAALRGRGQGRGQAPASQHRHRVRALPGPRGALHRDGAPARGPTSRPSCGRESPCSSRRSSRS